MKVCFDSDKEEIIFTTSFQEWTSKQIIINLNFSDPLVVSSGEKLDMMKIEIMFS
jgi:hypothetical protein